MKVSDIKQEAKKILSEQKKKNLSPDTVHQKLSKIFTVLIILIVVLAVVIVIIAMIPRMQSRKADRIRTDILESLREQAQQQEYVLPTEEEINEILEQLQTQAQQQEYVPPTEEETAQILESLQQQTGNPDTFIIQSVRESKRNN